MLAMNKYKYHGPFGTLIHDFIELKQALGYKYHIEALALKRFDKLTIEKYSSAKILTKEIVMNWCTKTSYEKQRTVCSRTTIIRQFAVYLNNLGLESYILPKNYFQPGEKYLPHIYTANELQKFFQQTDKCRYHKHSYYRHLIMPILFRLIYSCGLRISEARLLKVSDVDVNKGILSIYQSKYDNHRLVPMTSDLTKRMQLYAQQVHPCSNKERYFFPTRDNRPIPHGNIYKNFRIFLWESGISHGGKGVGPRIHDFRHTFAVHCLKKWSLEGKNLMTYLPVLRVYMGHCNFNETAYYLRLTADVFPEISLKLEHAYSNLIPDLKGGDYGIN